MKEYICSRCGKTFTQKCHFTYHIHRKIPCIERASTLQNAPNSTESAPKYTLGAPNSTENNQNILSTSCNKLTCKYCHKAFARSFTLNRHLESRCKKKQDYITQLEHKLAEANHNTNTNIVNSNSNNNNNNTVNNIDNSINNNINNNINNTLNDNRVINNNIHINMVSFGREKLSMLTENEKIKILTSGINAVLTHAELVHFNQRLPQYMNIYRTNLSNNTCDVFEAGKWHKADLKKMVELIIHYGVTEIQDIINEFPEQNGFLVKQTKDTLYDLENNNKKVTKEQTKKINLALYNEREKAIKNRLERDAYIKQVLEQKKQKK